MYTCPNCNHSSETPMNFCSKCGTKTVYTESVQQPAYEAPVQPAYEAPAQPVYEAPAQPAYEEPVYVAPPVKSGAPKGLVIAGMALSIAGMVLAAFGFLYTMIFWDSNIEGLAFGYALGFFFFSFPCGLVGLILSSKAKNAGDTSAMSTVGKILGLVSVILSGVTLVLGIIAAATYEPNYYGSYYNDYNYYNYY